MLLLLSGFYVPGVLQMLIDLPQESELSPEWEPERGNPVGACHLTRHSRPALVRDLPSVSVSLWLVEPNLNHWPFWVMLLMVKVVREQQNIHRWRNQSGVFKPAWKLELTDQQKTWLIMILDIDIVYTYFLSTWSTDILEITTVPCHHTSAQLLHTGNYTIVVT